MSKGMTEKQISERLKEYGIFDESPIDKVRTVLAIIKDHTEINEPHAIPSIQAFRDVIITLDGIQLDIGKLVKRMETEGKLV